MSGYQEEYVVPPQKKAKIEVDGVILTRYQEKTVQSYDPSVSSPFNTLPNEVIEHLFTFLDRESLKMSLLVDKRWKEIISNGLKVMKKLPLTIRLTRGAENQELKNFERRYRVVEFKNVDKKLPKYIENALTKIGSEVETVTFSDCSYEHKILEVLNCFLKIKNVVIEAEDYDRSAKPKVQLDSNVIKNLKTIRINRVTSVIKNFANAHQLTELFVNPVQNDFRHLIDLLSTQTRLKTLRIYNLFDIPAETEMSPLKCKVQELTLKGLSRGFSVKLLQFVKLFSSSVISLTIGGLAPLELLLPMVRDNFKVLAYLTMTQLVLPSPEFFEQQKTKFYRLGFLRIANTKFRNNAELVALFSIFPSIQQLQISSVDFNASITPEDIRNVTRGLVSVVCFVVHETVGMLQHAAFKNVSHMHLMTFDAAEKIDWDRIAINNPKMNSFVIKIKNNEDQLDFEALMQCNLKSFRFSIQGEFKMTEERLRSFMASPAHKVILVISESSLTTGTEQKIYEIAENHRNLAQLN